MKNVDKFQFLRQFAHFLERRARQKEIEVRLVQFGAITIEIVVERLEQLLKPLERTVFFRIAFDFQGFAREPLATLLRQRADRIGMIALNR